MPRGIPKTKIEPEPAPSTMSEPPLILLQPNVDGVQFTAYGLRPAEIIEALRLALVHVVARTNGATVVDEHIARSNRVITVTAVPAKPARTVGVPAPPKPKRLPEFAERRKPAFDEDDDEDLS